MASDRLARLEDLRRRAHGVRSIDPADEDFSDLKCLATAIGDARIVQLGESTHGDGDAFAAKVRIVKFLHQELGFDVLLWESGLYDVWRVNGALRDGEDPLAAAQLGIYTIWAESKEVLPLFEYARASHRDSRPLEMAGFDLQFSGRDIADLMEDLLRVVRLQDASAARSDETVYRLTQEVIHAYRDLEAPAARNGSRPPLESALTRFLSAVERLGNVVRRQLGRPGEPKEPGEHEERGKPGRFGRTQSSGSEGPDGNLEPGIPALKRGQSDLAVMERALVNLREHGIDLYEMNAADDPMEDQAVSRSWNRRDALMADNIRWLAETLYPKRKLIVWAHNGHIMNAYYAPDWNALSHEPQAGGMKPVGAFLSEWFGNQVYTVGFTAYSGQYELITMPGVQEIDPMPAESLEALLHDLGLKHAFLDFRSLPPDHWLRGESTVAIRGYVPERMHDWTRVVDAVFYIDRMTPPTPIRSE